MNNLISFTDKGLYCQKGDFYIDPWKPVDKAIITHGHSDHARSGHKNYLCHVHTKPILELRLGENSYQTVEWNERIHINGVIVSLHPAGHIIGSSQVRIESNGEVWVTSGDYKIEDDGISGKFEPLRCNTFITESTFGLPIYKWNPQQEIYDSIITWINKNKENGKTSMLLAYSLGKAQRVLQAIKETTQTIFAHGAVFNMQQMLIDNGWRLTPVERITPETPKELLKGAIVIAPPGADGTPWMKKFQPYSVGVCSGWMQVRGNARRRNVEAGFALSDHADWDGLLQAVKATGAEKVYVTHGFQSAFSRYCNEENIALAAEVKTQYGSEDEEVAEPIPEERLIEN
ncbi:MAG: ligase-associated DNA damage response exonuclease [Ginsengibacter sp.]